MSRVPRRPVGRPLGPNERLANPGELCACGLPARFVTTLANGREVGSCGLTVAEAAAVKIADGTLAPLPAPEPHEPAEIPAPATRAALRQQARRARDDAARAIERAERVVRAVDRPEETP